MAKVGIYPVEFSTNIRLTLVTKTLVNVDTFALGLRFDPATTYTVELEEGFVKETGANKFDSPGVGNLSQFTTNFTGPQIQVDEPSGSSVTNNTFIRYTYNRQLLAGNGNYYLYRETGSTDEEVAVFNASDSTGGSTISGDQITLDVTGLMRAGETYYVLIDEGAVEDKDGLAAFGFDNDQEHRWTTAPSTDVNFPDLSAVMTEAFAPTIAVNITVNPLTDMSITAAMTPTVNVIRDGVAPLFIDNTGFAARPNFTWDNAQSVSSQASQSAVVNFTTTNNVAPLSAEVDIGTPWFERLLINDSDQVDLRFTPDGTKYVRFYTDPSSLKRYKAEVYDFESGSLLNTIPSTGYRNVGFQSSNVGVGTFAIDNGNIYVGISGFPTGSTQTEGQIQKFPFTYETGDTIAYITDPDYYADNNIGGSPGVQLDPTLYNIGSAQIKMLDSNGGNPHAILYTIDTQSFSVTHTFEPPTIEAGDITDLASDVEWSYLGIGGTKTLITAPFYSVSNSNNIDLSKTLMKVYQNSTFKCDLAIPSGYKTTKANPVCAVNSSYAAVMLQSTTDDNDYKIRIYNADNGLFVRDIQDWYWNKSGVLQNSDANEVLDRAPTYLRLDESNNVYYRLYNLKQTDDYYVNGNLIRNYADYLTRIRNCATGNTVGDFDIAGLTTEYPQENRIIAYGGRYLNTLVSNVADFIQIWHK
jgi:hypothetical protein